MQLEEKGRKISFPRTSQATIHTNKILNNHQPNQLCNFLFHYKMSTTTNAYSIKMIIRENKTPPTGYTPKNYQVDSDNAEADNPDKTPFNRDFPRMIYGTPETYQADPRKVFPGPTEAVAAFNQDYDALDPLEKYYYSKWLYAYLADLHKKQQEQDEIEAREEEEHRKALEIADFHEERLSAQASGSTKKRRADASRQGNPSTTTQPHQIPYTDIDGHTIICDKKSQQGAMDNSNPLRRVMGMMRYIKFTDSANKTTLSSKKMYETLRIKNRTLSRASPSDRDGDDWRSTTLLHLIADHPAFKDPIALEKLLSFRFSPGAVAEFSYLQFHNKGAANFSISNPYHHIEALRNIATILYVVAGEPWKGIFNPTIDRIQYGDLNHLLKNTSSPEEHALLTDLITEAFNNAGAVVRSEETRIPTASDPSNKNTPEGVVADIAKAFADIPKMDDPAAVQAAILTFKNNGEFKRLIDELTLLKVKAPIKKRPKTPTTDDDSSRENKPAKKKLDSKAKENPKTTPKQPKSTPGSHCLSNLMLQWKGDGLFKNGNVREGETPCTDTTKCGKKHVGWKKIAADDLRATFTQGPDLFGQQNWQLRHYEHRLARDHATEGFEHACKIDGTPRTPKADSATTNKKKSN